MYQVDDMVQYGAEGVCRITEITTREFQGQCAQYYVLKPIYSNSNASIFVPVNSETLSSKIHKVLSAEEIYALIQNMPEEQLIWIEDEAQRRDRYKEILLSGDREEIIRMIKTLYLHQQRQMEKGKKLHVHDARIFKEAEKMLYEEFAHVLQIKRDQVLPFIMEQIEIKKKA